MKNKDTKQLSREDSAARGNEGNTCAGDGDQGSMDSGACGERNRNTPGRSPSELGLDPEVVRGFAVGRGDDARVGEASFRPVPEGERHSPEFDPRADLGDGGISASGGKAGGARGSAGRSDSGAGGPLGESRGGPGEYKSTSRGNLEEG